MVCCQIFEVGSEGMQVDEINLVNMRHEIYTGSDHSESNNPTSSMALLMLIRCLFSDYFCYALNGDLLCLFIVREPPHRV
jgi:hypothetical protein